MSDGVSIAVKCGPLSSAEKEFIESSCVGKVYRRGKGILYGIRSRKRGTEM
jgi:hypothetical protein